ncbi:MAG: DNA gyrase inhibitor YacG [Panacagrimonas sp.]
MSKTAPCPQCKQAASLDTTNRFRPFCSERCKLLDLGEWFAGRYTIPAAETDDGTDDASGGDSQDPQRLQ